MKKKLLIWILLDILLLVVVSAELWTLFGTNGKFAWEKSEGTEVSETVAVAEEILQEPEKKVEASKNSPSPSPAPMTPLSKSECAGQISGLLENAEGKWEIFISDTNGDIVMNKTAGENIRAGDIEYFFMTHQVYHDVKLGNMELSALSSADAMLEKRDGQSYSTLYNLLCTSKNVIWQEQPTRMKINLENESYPHTFWDEESIGYTSAEDGCHLIGNIVWSAEKGDEYALREQKYLEQNWNTGPVSDQLRKQNTRVLELASRNGDRVEDFSYIAMEDGTQYQIGIMVKNVSNPDLVKETIGKIAELSHQYFSSEDHAEDNQISEQSGTVSGLEDLRSELLAQTADYQERISIYVKDLSENVSMEITDGERHKAASLIKLYVMASVYDQIQKGTLIETEDISSLLTNMITVSDNESTNELVRRQSPDGTDWEAGSTVTNSYIADNGYPDTYMGRDVRDFRETPADGENYTSVSDCGKILEEIYRGTCVSQEYSQKMLELLKQQQRRGKIPAGIPSAEYIANKTGELNDVEHDAAIVKLDGQNAYILCVMSDQVTVKEQAVDHIAAISKTVYDYFSARK